ncbi:MAG: hypothetical protein ACYDBP_10305 [Leptospirales bacterium]
MDWTPAVHLQRQGLGGPVLPTFEKTAVALSGTPVPVDQEYARFIGPETPWLREVPSQILRNGAVRWRHAYDRFFAGLAGRPTFRRKDGTQSVWITSELFALRYEDKTHTEELILGTKKFPVGVLSFTAHTPYTRPASLHLSVEAGKVVPLLLHGRRSSGT